MAIFSKKTKEEKQPQQKTQDEPAMRTQTALPKVEDPYSYGAVLSPHVTEKGSNMGALGKYVFRISKDANKISVKKAIEKLYKVSVTGVNVINVRPKKRRVGRYEGQKAGYKKAVVTLKQGDKIEIG